MLLGVAWCRAERGLRRKDVVYVRVWGGALKRE